MSNLIPVNDMSVMADSIVKSNFYGFKTREQVMAVMLVAQAEGKHPASVLSEYDIIQGRPALKSQAMLARFQLAGGSVQWDEVTPKKVKGTFKHPQGGTLTVEWTIEMAKAAGLVRDGSGWSKYPEDMLRSRVVSRAVRSVYPACILGHYAVEEVMDFDSPAPKVKDMGAAEEIIEAQPTGRYHIVLPDGTIYSSHQTQEEWLDAYKVLVDKIRNSTKFTDEQKRDKYIEFMDANETGRKMLDVVHLATFNSMFPVERKPKPKKIDPIVLDDF